MQKFLYNGEKLIDKRKYKHVGECNWFFLLFIFSPPTPQGNLKFTNIGSVDDESLQDRYIENHPGYGNRHQSFKSEKTFLSFANSSTYHTENWDNSDEDKR